MKIVETPEQDSVSDFLSDVYTSVKLAESALDSACRIYYRGLIR